MAQDRAIGLLQSKGLLVVALVVALASPPTRANEPTTLLNGGWRPDTVGLLDASGTNREALASPDLRILDAVGKAVGIGFSLHPVRSAKSLAAVEAGEIDFALPMVDRGNEDHVHAIPYASRSQLLFLSASVAVPPVRGLDLLRWCLARGLRLAIVRDEPHGAALDALLSEATWKSQIVPVASDGEAVRSVLKRRVDGFVSESMAGLSALADNPAATDGIRIVEEPVSTYDVYLTIHRRSVSEAEAEAIAEAVRSLRDDGTVDRLEDQASLPVRLRIAVASNWFKLLDIVGTIAFALSGVLIARRERYSLFGAFVLAALPAVGGGVVRDLLVGRAPIAVLGSPLPLLLVCGTVLAVFAIFRGLERMYPSALAATAAESARGTALRRIFDVTDAIGLSAFTVVGVVVAVRYQAEPLWLWGPLCACLSGAGGGILREVMRADSDNPALHRSFYAEICVLWGLFLSLAVWLLARTGHDTLLRAAVICTVLGAFATRMAVIRFGIHSPQFRA